MASKTGKQASANDTVHWVKADFLLHEKKTLIILVQPFHQDKYNQNSRKKIPRPSVRHRTFLKWDGQRKKLHILKQILLTSDTRNLHILSSICSTDIHWNSIGGRRWFPMNCHDCSLAHVTELELPDFLSQMSLDLAIVELMFLHSLIRKLAKLLFHQKCPIGHSDV